jgi:hypothetical protein
MRVGQVFDVVPRWSTPRCPAAGRARGVASHRFEIACQYVLPQNHGASGSQRDDERRTLRRLDGGHYANRLFRGASEVYGCDGSGVRVPLRPGVRPVSR